MKYGFPVIRITRLRRVIGEKKRDETATHSQRNWSRDYRGSGSRG